MSEKMYGLNKHAAETGTVAHQFSKAARQGAHRPTAVAHRSMDSAVEVFLPSGVEETV